jgi:non-specific serine/threonine protein kinase
LSIAAKTSLSDIDFEAMLRSVSPTIVARGRAYHLQRRAKVDYVDREMAVVLVRGSQRDPYEVEIWTDQDRSGEWINIECDCPYAEDSPRTMCKHKVAALLALRDHLGVQHKSEWSGVLKKALDAVEVPKKNVARHILVFNLLDWGGGYQVHPYVVAEDVFKDDVRGDVDAMAKALLRSDLRAKARRVQSQRGLDKVVPMSTTEIAAARILAENWRYYPSPSIDLILPMLAESIVMLGSYNGIFSQRAKICTTPGRLELQVHRGDGALKLVSVISQGDRTLPLASTQTTVVSGSPVWIVVGSEVLPVQGQPALISTFLKHSEIVIPEADADSFLDEYLLPLVEHVPIVLDGVGEWRDLDVEPVRRVYLKEVDSELIAELRFGYDAFEVPFDRSQPAQSVRRGAEPLSLVRIHRDTAAEREAWSALSSYGLKRSPNEGAFVLRQNVSAVDLLLYHVPKLSAAGYEVYGEEDLKSVRVNRNRPKLSLSVSSGIDWFDVQAVVSFGDLEVSLGALRRAVQKREQYIKLADGSMGEIPGDWVNQYRHLFAMAGESEDGLRVTKSQVMLLDQALSEADSAEVDEEFERRRSRLKDFSRIEPKPLPEGLSGELRHYQKAGYDWLHFLHEYEFGGCLADDMGIGKTVQALACLQSLRENGHATSADLVVMPRSLLVNWEREAARFTPSLKVHIHADLDRIRDVAEFDGHDVVLTTYGVMRRDIDILTKYRFHFVVLDESQAVKNPLCHTARAARMLKCDHRLVLTGTPVENSTVELYSQFAFLNPGMLGSLDYFKKEFAGPIERHQDDGTARYLRSLVYPFILRRTKAQVAPELPPRTERIIYCDMDHAQRGMYDRRRDEYRALLLGMIDSKGMNNARMKILEGLLRLRQICDHPKLVDRSYKGESSKIEVLIETIETLRAEGHKALIFSQFTQMLKLIRCELDERRIPYLYLDGTTKDRQALVDRFQGDPEIPFFLISLKAGGVGLNLTAADYVIHVDPWWNPAVEAQASDRTHRIGQENPVFIHKLIARDTVEQKMIELQARKRELVDKLISTEGSFFKSLTADDVRDLFS